MANEKSKAIPLQNHTHTRKKGAFKGRERRGRDLYPTSALEAAAFPLKMIREKFIRALCPSNMHRPCQVGGLALPSRGVPCFVSSLFYSRGFGEKQPVGFFGVSLGGRNNAFLVYVYILSIIRWAFKSFKNKQN